VGKAIPHDPTATGANRTTKQNNTSTMQTITSIQTDPSQTETGRNERIDTVPRRPNVRGRIETGGGSDMSEHRFPYKWTLKDATFTKDKGKVFSCFACGGGSTMGYKLAGFDVLGCNEIDPKMMEAYVVNHNPKYAYLEPIQTFKLRKDLPQELYNLDILDGSPPCSSFSMAGNREKDWGNKKKFREGQAEQVLDNLFFDFIDLAKELQPKVVVAENVKGLLLGNAREYVRRIYRELDNAGYYCQHWLLDASKMGVPQRRERVFFVAFRKDLATPFLYQQDMFTVNPKLELNFNEPEIPWDVFETNDKKPTLTSLLSIKLWTEINPGQTFADHPEYNNGFGCHKIKRKTVLPTIIGKFRPKSGSGLLHPEVPRVLNKIEYCCGGTFPQDYNFTNNQYGYIIGMSVPPVMTAQIATEIYNQWLSKL
jgi:DNA (cytosine-5)-methyltransferase 1